MTMLQGFRIALHALRLNPLRSFLTMLGIVIGVASIVTVFAIGAGAQLRLQEQIRSIGANVLMITPGAVYQGGVRLKEGSKLTMTESDVQAILEQIPEVQAAAGSIAGTAQVIHEGKNWNTTINGTTTGHFMVRDWQLASGRYFSGTEEAGAGKVVILGSTVARELFAPGDDPIGAQIRIMKVPLEVVGVLDHKDPSQDDVAFVPLTTAKLRFLGSASNINRDSVAYIIAKVTADGQMAGARSEIESLLRQRHRILAGQEDDFKVQDPAAAMEAQQGAIRTVALLLVAIASVSLLVGGISIMNVMIVSVTERTREIGIRRALGGRMRDIRLQFLCEALVLCLLGGAIGVIGGVTLSMTVARMAGWITSIDSEAIALALAFSIATGLIFGFYPAHKASKLSPIEALKTE
ncbi:ABC transporter permease [Bradyrhizobium neotropicale]|uniref:ABC transporter permease n=1 Tax=Bradyrhizobium neotropicale TaxID=1497615 RepID=A0A176Z1A0_9BRAD|nr:ABC transporter permease [Bradyrhizobium neotropicale]OAF14149.1 ABC transporter permease [Bradyrhizobium neotropicale]